MIHAIHVQFSMRIREAFRIIGSTLGTASLIFGAGRGKALLCTITLHPGASVPFTTHCHDEVEPTVEL
jgi:hypothetical protein